ncbi:MAG: metal-dependent hydrolase [Patescibacteria group bacterium]
MVFPGHIAAGYLTALGVVTFAGFSLTPNEQALLLTLGSLLGDAPDIDVFYSFLKKKTTGISALQGHRDHITHMPLLWLLIGLFVYVFTDSNFGKVLGLLIWLCSWSHLLCDSIFSSVGIQWLKPFSEKRFTLFRKPDMTLSSWKELLPHLVKSPIFYLEFIVAFTAIAVFIVRNFF